jgi:hypothetical protein
VRRCRSCGSSCAVTLFGAAVLLALATVLVIGPIRCHRSTQVHLPKSIWWRRPPHTRSTRPAGPVTRPRTGPATTTLWSPYSLHVVVALPRGLHRPQDVPSTTRCAGNYTHEIPLMSRVPRGCDRQGARPRRGGDPAPRQCAARSISRAGSILDAAHPRRGEDPLTRIPN